MLNEIRHRVPTRLDRFAVDTATGLLVLTAGAAGFTLLLLLVRSAWAPLQGLDQWVADSLNNLVSADGLLQEILHAVTDFGGHTLLVRVLLLATLYLLIRREFRLAAYVMVTSVGALILDPTLKLLVGRLRPVVDIPLSVAPGNSFPSGHALGSFVSYGVLLLVFLPAVPRRWRVTVITLTAVLVAAVGVTRMALGVHYLTDVLAGWLLGAAWLAVTTAAFRHWRRDTGLATPAVTEGLAPEEREDLRAAPAEGETLAHPGHTVAELAVAWVLVLGALYGAGMLITTVMADGAVVAADKAVVRWLVAHRDPALGGVATVGSRLGNTHWILVGTLTAAVLLVGLRRRLRPVIFLAAVMLGEVTLFLTSSTAVTRARPDVPHLGPEIPPTASFPSGHVAATLCLYIAIGAIAWRLAEGWLRWAAVLVAVFAPTYVALARMYWGVHHPLDIAGSLLLALPWIAACWWSIRPVPEASGRGAREPARHHEHAESG